MYICSADKSKASFFIWHKHELKGKRDVVLVNERFRFLLGMNTG